MSISTLFRSTASYLVVLLLAPILGLLVAWNWSIGLLLISGLLGAVFLANVIRNIQIGLLFLFLSITFVDLIRRVVGYVEGAWAATYIWLLIQDAALIMIILSFYTPSFVRQENHLSAVLASLPPFFKLVLSFFVLWVILQMLNPYYPSIVISLAAVREYLLAIPVIGLGWFVVHHWDQQQWRRAYRIVLITAAGCIAISLLQIAIDRSQLSDVVMALVLPADAPAHSWYSGSITLVSSVFASSKRYGQFLLLTYPLLWAYLDVQRRRFSKGLVFMLYAVGCVVSGSREAIYLLLLMELLLEREWHRMVRPILIFVLVFFLLGVVGTGIIEEERLNFIVSDSEDWMSRVDYMLLFSLSHTGLDMTHLLTGIGAGRWGQAVQLLGLPERVSLLGPIEQFGPLGDAGLFKILVELGIIGLVIFLALQGSILREAWPWRQEVQKDAYYLAAGVAIIVWMVLFLKRHTLLSDQTANVFFWFYVGILMAKRSALSVCRKSS